ncbi:MAG: hypothetical protein ABW352_13455 [Polyangiales bacterium]
MGLVGLLCLSACGDDDSSDDGGSNLGDAGMDGGNNLGLDSGTPGAGDASIPSGGDSGGNTPAAAPKCNDGKWVVGGYNSTQDVDQGYLHSLSDLGANSQIDLAKVKSFDASATFRAYPDGVVFVGHDEKSTIEKWQLQGDGSWKLLGTVDLRNQGVTSASLAIERVSDTKAYYFDGENNQVIGFNPQTMLHDGVVIDLKPGFGLPGDFMNIARVHLDGDVFVVAARFWNPDYSVKKSIQAAFVDTKTNTVSFAEDTRCGGTYYRATDAAGNLYLGAHVSNLFDRVAGSTSEASDSCIVRIKKGEKKFDPDYYTDMNKLLGGLGAVLIQGPGDTAFIQKYEGPALTADNFKDARLGAHWDVYSLELGDEANTVTKLQLPVKTIAYGNGFVTRCEGRETGFLVLSGANWAGGQFFQVVNASTVQEGLKYTGSIGEDVVRLD